MKIIQTTLADPAFQMLIAHLDADLNTRYGVLQSQYDVLNQVIAVDAVVIAFDGETPVGCGCFKRYDAELVEMKRMFVEPEYRGSGMASEIILKLEALAREAGFTGCVLETGIGQPEAIRFYTKLGYQTIENYGPYIGNDHSVCFKKIFQQSLS
jgi:putative acetyltransferase